MRHILILTLLSLAFLGGLSIARADVRLAPVFGSNMVLQRDVQAKIAGWADSGEAVVVKLGDKVIGKVIGEGKDKPWTVTLPVMKAGPIPDITVEGKNTVTLTNLLAGDVWVCSGQSNMYMTLQKGPWCSQGGALNADQEVAAANHPTLRLMKSPGGNWEVCSPDSAKSFSAAGYFFGRELNSRLDVPIGLVMAAVGGTEAELWTPRSAREVWSGYAAEQEEAKKIMEELKPIAAVRAKAMTQWQKDAEAAKKENKQVPPLPPNSLTDEQVDQKHWADAALRTGRLYDTMIKPLTVMPIKGAIWYQGESNSRRAYAYPELMSQLIGGWRKAWGQDEFPFLLMQLVNFEFARSQPWLHRKGYFAALRAAQRRITETVPNTGLAVGIDIGSPDEIHPRNKQEVGRRLALVALKQVYTQEVISSGPRLTAVNYDGGQAHLTFDPGGQKQQLVLSEKTPTGFEMAGTDGTFVPALATLKENTLILTAPTVNAPRAVRYAWQDNPPATLFNSAGLPAEPFEIGNGRAVQGAQMLGSDRQ